MATEQRPNDQRRDRPGKIQGEGDYDSAKRFNESERQFVESHGTPRQPDPDPTEESELRKAEEKGKSRSRGREHDAVDEELFREGISDDDAHSKGLKKN